MDRQRCREGCRSGSQSTVRQRCMPSAVPSRGVQAVMLVWMNMHRSCGMDSLSRSLHPRCRCRCGGRRPRRCFHAECRVRLQLSGAPPAATPSASAETPAAFCCDRLPPTAACAGGVPSQGWSAIESDVKCRWRSSNVQFVALTIATGANEMRKLPRKTGIGPVEC